MLLYRRIKDSVKVHFFFRVLNVYQKNFKLRKGHYRVKKKRKVWG